MSLHKSWFSSLSSGGSSKGKVLKRELRIEMLKKIGAYKEGMYYNLPGGAARAWEASVVQAEREEAKKKSE
jgi:small basic protein (TIGR04137 family)